MPISHSISTSNPTACNHGDSQFCAFKDEVNAGALIQAGNQHAELITACFSEANSVEGLDKCLSFFITVLKDIGPRILTSNGDEMPAGTSFMEMVLTYMTQTLVSYAYCSSKNFNVDLILSALTLVLQLLLEIYTRVDLDKVQMAAADFIIQAIFIENLIPQISTCIQEWLQPEYQFPHARPLGAQALSGQPFSPSAVTSSR